MGRLAMDYKHAADRLKMTIHLLKWSAGHSPKSDGRKLEVSAEGDISEEEIESFEKYLREPWTARYVPAGISKELKREARGSCGCCGDPCTVLEEAHIDRKDIEAEFYCQHPHNLILLCRNCHGRYDDATDKFITNDVIKHCKNRLLEELIKDVRDDVARAEGIRRAHQQMMEEARTKAVSPTLWWDGHAMEVFQKSVLEQGMDKFPIAAGIRPGTGAELKDALIALSGSLGGSEPATAGTLRSMAQGVGDSLEVAEKDEWEYVPQDSECSRCLSPAMLDSLVCAACEQDDNEVHDNENYLVEEEEGGHAAVYLEEADGEYRVHRCPNCGSEHFSQVCYRTYCAYCEHMWHRWSEE